MSEISQIRLIEGGSNGSVPAELWDEIQPEHVVLWETEWVPERDVVLSAYERAGVPRSEWPQSRGWNWADKLGRTEGMLAYRTFSVVCDGSVQGMMRVKVLARSAREASQAGAELAYVDVLEVAPWNWPTPFQTPRYKGGGMALMTAAAFLSREEGFKGRLGLHALPQAEAFYRDRCGMIDLGSDPDYGGLRYFEMTTTVADAFLK